MLLLSLVVYVWFFNLSSYIVLPQYPQLRSRLSFYLDKECHTQGVVGLVLNYTNSLEQILLVPNKAYMLVVA